MKATSLKTIGLTTLALLGGASSAPASQPKDISPLKGQPVTDKSPICQISINPNQDSAISATVSLPEYNLASQDSSCSINVDDLKSIFERSFKNKDMTADAKISTNETTATRDASPEDITNKKISPRSKSEPVIDGEKGFLLASIITGLMTSSASMGILNLASHIDKNPSLGKQILKYTSMIGITGAISSGLGIANQKMIENTLDVSLENTSGVTAGLTGGIIGTTISSAIDFGINQLKR